MMTKRNYECPVFKEVRLACLKRDKKKCQMPGCGLKRRLQVHHIERWTDASSLRFELFNCITLCYQCHLSIKDKEHHYVSLFRSIISGHN
jgi:5-methylcytosine-specific restriction endonuclease McrA